MLLVACTALLGFMSCVLPKEAAFLDVCRQICYIAFGDVTGNWELIYGLKMRLFILLMLWLLVFVCVPMVAIVALALLPIVWVISLPFRLVSLVIEALFSFMKGILFLPARLLGVRPTA